MSFRVSAIRDLRFDERRVGYALGEDVDFSLRAQSRGVLLALPTAEMQHYESPVERLALEHFARQLAKHRLLLARDGLGGVRTWRVVAHSPMAGLHIALRADSSWLIRFKAWWAYTSFVMATGFRKHSRLCLK